MSAPEKSAWDDYRRWNRALRISIVVGFILGGTMLLFGIGVGIFVMVLPGIAFFLSLQYYRCPQCDECFCYEQRFLFNKSDLFANKCVHCGLLKWEEPSVRFPKVDIHPIPKGGNPGLSPIIAERLRLAKFLSLVLREDPKAIGLRLDENGWTDIDVLLKRAQRNGLKLTHGNLAEVLTASSIHRFEWDETGNRIRASRKSPAIEDN